jgi:hypothetical protein
MNHPSIRIEGAILSPELIDRLEDAPGQRPADFALETGSKVKDEIARAWADAQDYWRIFQRKLASLKPDSPATSETRNLWLVPLLGLLRYELEFQKAGAELNGKIYAISHRVTHRAQTPVHIVGCNDPAGLDRKPANASLRMSAHALVQEYLNLHEQLYGIVTNGRVLRLLRDSSRLIKQSYLEFDLDRIFIDGLFADFAVLYRLLHASRLPISNETATESLLERYHQDSLDSGARIREGLSKAVEYAILGLGNGFLSHPKNSLLRDCLASGDLSPADYYKSLLRLIYRLLFLMVIEERDLVFPEQTPRHQRDTYFRFYSLQRLRSLSEKRHLADKRQHDLWLALLSTFRLFEADGPGLQLGVKPLAGDLFRAEAIGALGGCHLANDQFLDCLRALGLYENPRSRQLIRVNYAALNVEEFGSVYEGLLEYEPSLDFFGTVPRFGFKQGDQRAATGSHYTPDDLVQPLIKHSLDHLIADCLKATQPADALLALRVADIACGSGHILLAAARRIAVSLATVRTGEEQPSPSAYRGALRDVIRTCIYGVDLNPLAVELCKVALWLEAHNPGEPLNFLDHHIKCGNAIVGFVKREEVDQGIPDEAFAKLPGDDSEIGRRVRARNKAERAQRNQVALRFTGDRSRELDAVLEHWKTITALPERTPAEIDTKAQAFHSFASGGSASLLKRVASLPIAQFYLPRTESFARSHTTDATFREYWSGDRSPEGQALSDALAMADRKRFFHWFLEFPEIIQRGGFDCVLGNPPYLGDKDLSGTYGYEFCNYVRSAFAPTGLADLVVYFLRRMFGVVAPKGFVSFITTNSIKDGDIRKDGLEQVIASGAEINMAVRGVKWPGLAKLVVSLVSLHNGHWTKPRNLDGKIVPIITSHFETNADIGEPQKLVESIEKIFTGYYWLGDGFLISHEQAAELVRQDARYGNVLFKTINGNELNNEPDQFPQRSIINFHDRDEASARMYRAPFEIVETKVKPARAALNRSRNKEFWWIYGENRPSLTKLLSNLDFCFAAARTTKYLNFSAKNSSIIFSDALNVFTTDRWDLFAVVQSTVHEIWARKYSGALKQDLRYSPSKCFDTYPFPRGQWQVANPCLAALGEQYHEHRRALMLRLWLGLTDVYNLFHSSALEADLRKHFSDRSRRDPEALRIPEEYRAAALAYPFEVALGDLEQLRRLHVELDLAVRDAYGWQELDLGHAFHEVETLPENDRTRYTLSPDARKELLRRLLQENHARAEEEAAAAPRPAAATAARKQRATKTASTTVLPAELDLF